MMAVIVPMKQTNPVQLKAELLAAGIPDWPEPLGDLAYAGSGLAVVNVPDGSDLEVVVRVVGAHRDARTPQQIKQDQSARVLSADDADSIRTRAFVVAMSDILNDLASRIAARQNPRTWSPAQIAALIRSKIEALITH